MSDSSSIQEMPRPQDQPSGTAGPLASITPHLLLAFAFSAAVNTLFLASPLYMMQLYGRVLDSRSIETLISLSIALVLALIAMAGADAARGRLLARAGARLDRKLTMRSAQSALLEGRGGSTRAIDDIETARRFCAGGSCATLMDAPFTLLFIFVLFILHPLLGIVATAGVIIILATLMIARMVNAGRETHINSAQQKFSHLTSGLEFDRGEVRALGLHGGLADRMSKQRQNLGGTRLDVLENTASVSAGTRFVRMLAHSGALAAGAVLAIDGQVTPAAMFAAAILAGRALGPIETLPNALRQLSGTRAALKRLVRSAVVTTPTGAGEPNGSTGAVVAADRGMSIAASRLVAAHPDAARPALRSMSFSIEAGETVAVAGASESGKSTLARCLVGAETPRSGTIRLNGTDIRAIPTENLSRLVGWLPQDAPLFPGTVRDNIARFGQISDEIVARAADRAGIRAAVERLPNAFQTEIETGGRNISMGLRQGIGLARALVTNPGLLVLDQPTSHMDAEGEVAVLNAIRALKHEGVTILVISHKPVLAALADRIMLLEDGTIGLFEDRVTVLETIRTQSMRAVGTRPAPAAAPPSDRKALTGDQ